MGWWPLQEEAYEIKMAQAQEMLVKNAGPEGVVDENTVEYFFIHILVIFRILNIKYKEFILGKLIFFYSLFCLFLYLDGCFLTIVEYKLCKNDMNIIDPYILLGEDEITPNTRYWYTLGIALLYFTATFLILYVRGCFKWPTFSDFKIEL